MTDYVAKRLKELAKLPPIASVEQIRQLPWHGNAAGDCPLMAKIEREFVFNDQFPRVVRQEAAEVAGELMTGEDCRFTADYTFEDYERDCR